MFQASDQKWHMVVLSPSLGEIMGTWPHLMAREAGEWRAPAGWACRSPLMEDGEDGL